MKQVTYFCLLVLCLQLTSGQSLRVVMGRWLYYQHGQEMFKVKELKEGEFFQGYDVIDTNRIFLAYCFSDSRERSTNLSIFDVQANKEEKVRQMEGATDSWFSYSASTRLIVLNSENGLHVWDSANMRQTEPELIYYEPKKCLFPYWLDSKTIGYIECAQSSRTPGRVSLKK